MTRIDTSGIPGKEAAVRDWARRKLGSLDHELRVARLAETLFELTRKRHGLGVVERRLLGMAALVHDVGRSVEDEGHERHGAKMLLENTSLPLSESERRRLAYLTRYHKGRVPCAGDENILERDAGDDVSTLRVLLGLLRAADSLDRRSVRAARVGSLPRLVISVRGRELVIRGYVNGPAAVAATQLGKAKKLRLMEETLGLEIRTEWYSMDAVALVA